MLKSDLVQTDKHSIKILLRRKNLRFLRRTNHNTNSLYFIIQRTKKLYEKWEHHITQMEDYQDIEI